MKNKTRRFYRILAIVLLTALVLMGGCSGGTSNDESGNFHSAGESGTQSWVIYMYICGSDLETDYGFATDDLAELSNVRLPEGVKVIIQTGGSLAWNNDLVDSSAMYRLEYSNEGFNVVETVTSTSMGDPNTLTAFLNFCEENYQADHKGLIFWDHGGGSGSGICFDELFDNDYLTLPELQSALGGAYEEPGTQMPFEFIGFDTCLMATIDTAAVCSGYAKYMVASEEIEPGCGWKYDGWLSALAENPHMDGSELGIAICDSYYEGCEEFGLEDMVTLSTIDLTQIDEVVWALDALSREGIEAALENSPAVFFADYGRGANKADYYRDGSPEMVDLVSLIFENKHLFPQTADPLLKSIENSVVYQRTGPYRANSNGISAYFPYKMNVDNYYNFYNAAASPAMSYMYELLIEGTFSDEAQQYLSQAEEFETSLLESEYEFANVSAYGLEDHRVDIIEENDVTYAQINIGSEAADSLQSVTFMLVSYSDDGETAVMLGEEYDMISDWENGVFTDNFRGVWGAIDGHVVMMTVTSITDDYILYDVPLLLNGELCGLSVAYLFEDGSYKLLTATPDDGGTGIAAKQQYLLTTGDEITTLLYYLDNSDEGFYEVETFTITADSSFGELELPDGIYGFMYLMTDYKNNSYSSEVVGVVIEDGFPVMLGLD